MNKFLLIFTLLLFFSYSCKKDKLSEDDPPVDPCSQLVDGVYQYPTEPPDPSLTNAQKMEYWNIPEDVLPCLETDGLVETCCNYPDLWLCFTAGTYGLISGYDLLSRYLRGIGELESRTDAIQSLLNKYISLDTTQIGSWASFFIELSLGRDSIILHSNTEQKKTVVLELLTKQLLKQELNKPVGVFYSEGTIYSMARIMYRDNFEPFLDIYEANNKIQLLIGYGAYYHDEDVINTIVDLANTYLLK